MLDYNIESVNVK